MHGIFSCGFCWSMQFVSSKHILENKDSRFSLLMSSLWILVLAKHRKKSLLKSAKYNIRLMMRLFILNRKYLWIMCIFIMTIHTTVLDCCHSIDSFYKLVKQWSFSFRFWFLAKMNNCMNVFLTSKEKKEERMVKKKKRLFTAAIM